MVTKFRKLEWKYHLNCVRDEDEVNETRDELCEADGGLDKLVTPRAENVSSDVAVTDGELKALPQRLDLALRDPTA